jgi:RNA polymerase sigma factor (TIGR02999 family)
MEKRPSGDITQLLNGGNRSEREKLASLLYADLRRIGARIMASERVDHTLQATILASDAYLDLIENGSQVWESRAHFFAVAARSMRQGLVDYSRKKKSLKRGGLLQRQELSGVDDIASRMTDPDELLALDVALSRLSRFDPRLGLIVELRYFGGLTEEEVADILRISVRTVKRDWPAARAWLAAELSSPPKTVSRERGGKSNSTTCGVQ